MTIAFAKTVVPAANLLILDSTPFVLSGRSGTGGGVVLVGVLGGEVSVSSLGGVTNTSLSEELSSWTDSGY